MVKQAVVVKEEEKIVKEIKEEEIEIQEATRNLGRFVTVKGNPILLFGRWDTRDIAILDKGLANYITIEPVYAPISRGRKSKQMFYKSQMSILERLLNHMYVAGHRGRKHKISSGRNVGKSQRLWGILEKVLLEIEKKEKKNPVQILIEAVVNSAPIEEAISYQKGGSMARKAVVIAPQRRIDLALRMLSQGAFENGFNNKKSAVQTWASELVAASKNDKNCKAIKEKERREKEAEGAR